ncbi:hypothetical protein JST56_05250 [Candidatus Dependentiae bacterium]|nr:hypothetical protein [Candidatus Dependentiae bacterium]
MLRKIILPLILIIFLTTTCFAADTALAPTANVMFGQAQGQEQINASSQELSKAPSPLALPTITAEGDSPIAVGHEVKKDEEEANIYLNFNAVSLLNVVNYLGDLKNINILPHKDLEAAKVTLSTRAPLTLTRAWDVLLTLMEMNGFTIVNVDGMHRVVSNKENAQEPLPTYSSLEYGTKKGIEPEDLPDNDMIVRYVYFFKNIKAEVAEAILRQLLPGEKATIINKDLNACIIKEQCSNIKAALKIIKELDTGGLRESIQVIKLKYADAQTIHDLFKDVLGGGQEEQRTIRFSPLSSQQEKRYFSSTTKIIPDQSKNSLILLGTEVNINKIVGFIQKNLDVPIGDADSRLHIKEIRHAKAEVLRPILENIVRPPKGQGSEKSAVVGEYKFFEDVLIANETAEAAGEGKRGSGNRLIIACNKDDWSRLEQFIEKLDKPQPQVAIEVMIIDVNLDQSRELGAQMHNFRGKNPGLGINEIDFKNLSSLPSTKTTDGKTVSNMIQLTNPDNLGKGSPSFLTFGGATTANQSIWAVIRSAFNINNSHIVSQPFLVANNYQPCFVEVKETRRIPGDFVSSHGEQSRRRQVDVPASVKIDLTPSINVDGFVDLTLDINIDEFKADSSDPDTPTKSTRSLKTRVSLMTGEVLVLGGLTRGDQQESHYRTPLLAEIPILGNFFKSKTKSKAEGNLYVFLRPSIIKPRFEGEPDEYTQLKLDYAKLQMMRNDTYTRDSDPIQRWFFKPTNQSIKSKVSETKRGIFRPIDDFTYGQQRPTMVRIAEDPFYKVSEAIEQTRAAVASKKLKQRGGQQRLSVQQAPENAAHKTDMQESIDTPQAALIANNLKPDGTRQTRQHPLVAYSLGKES